MNKGRSNPVRGRRDCMVRVAALPVAMLVLPQGSTAQTAQATPGGGEQPPDEVRRRRPAARLSGRGTLRFLGLHIYDALLWVENAIDSGNFVAHPLALELRYARSLYGSLIAERSLREMERAGPIPATQSERWLAFMREAFPDVGAGDRITGLWNPADETSEFVINGKAGKALRDRAFGERFFGIWLGNSTSEPALRQALLGRKAP